MYSASCLSQNEISRTTPPLPLLLIFDLRTHEVTQSCSPSLAPKYKSILDYFDKVFIFHGLETSRPCTQLSTNSSTNSSSHSFVMREAKLG